MAQEVKATTIYDILELDKTYLHEEKNLNLIKLTHNFT